MKKKLKPKMKPKPSESSVMLAKHGKGKKELPMKKGY